MELNNEKPKFFDRTVKRLTKLTWLEAMGMVALAVLIFNLLFEVNVTVERKPLLLKLLGQTSRQTPSATTNFTPNLEARLQEVVLPPQGLELPISWKGLGKQLIDAGVIDAQKFETLYNQRGGLNEEEKQLLYQINESPIKITRQNANYWLNLLWALGLGNKNSILENGEMTSKAYGGDPARFASTGGWTLAQGNVMDHYSKHTFIKLTPEQQTLVDRVSQNIYRPCCGNSVHFPDCNHGMAMLGLLQLLAAQGIGEQDMYRYALTVNAYWFPDTYLTIAKFLNAQGQDYATTDPKLLLSAQFSSAQGFRQILNQVQPVQNQGGGGCGV